MATAVLNKITFRSKHSNLRILRTSAEQVIHPTLGTVQTTKPEIVYEFANGVLELAPGFHNLADLYNEATNEWDSRDAIEYMRTHPLHGIRFFEIEPVAPDPSVALAAITDALIAGDITALERIGDDEFASFRRPEIMETVNKAHESLQAQQEAAVPPADKPPTKGS